MTAQYIIIAFGAYALALVLAFASLCIDWLVDIMEMRRLIREARSVLKMKGERL